MIRIVFLISALSRGGAERQLTLLIKGMDRSRFDVTVVTVYDGGALRAEIEGIEEVRILSLGKEGLFGYPSSLWRMARFMRQVKPQIIHGYMDVANELALLFGKLIRARVVWGLRASNVDFSQYGRTAAQHFHMAARVSRYPDLIIANSYAGKQYHAAHGYPANKIVVIPNGFDIERFRPDHAAGRSLRLAWGISDDVVLIGLVARIDPMKDHPTFLRAAALLASERDDIRFVCVGGGRESYRDYLVRLANELGLGARLLWAGEQGDMTDVQNALDIATSSTAFGEGFSNAIGEAMACGIPCVVTDVGDSALLVNSTGVVVPPCDHEALAAAWRTLLSLPKTDRVQLGHAARIRITNEFSVQQLVRRTEDTLLHLV